MKLQILTTLSTVLLLTFSGCTKTPKVKKELKIDVTLPIVELTPNGVFSDMNAVAFEWKSLNNSDVEGVNIYKQSKYYATINNRFATHYVDYNIKPNSKYNYTFKTFSKDAQSQSSKPINIKSLDVLNSVTWIYSITGMPRSAKLLWRPHINEKVKSYIIERKLAKEKEYKEVGRIDGRLNAEFIDKDLEDNNIYNYRVKVITFDNIVSTPSTVVNVNTREIPLKIDNLQATKSLAKKIKLTWNKSNSKYFNQYYLYRSQNVDSNDYQLIGTLYKNSYTDIIKEDGKKFFYRVSAVDVDGLESKYKKNTVLGMTIPKPKTPHIVKSKFSNNKIEISWDNLDSRTQKYTVVKIKKEGWFNEVKELFSNITTNSFTDTKISKGNSYFYKVYAIDKDSIASKYSNEVEVIVPLDKVIQKAVVIEAEDIDVVSDLNISVVE